MNRGAAHTALIKSILAELGSLPGVVIGINESGRAEYFSDHGKQRYVPFGWPLPGGGSPDILAVVAPLGRMVAIEVKTGNAVTSAEQRQCHAALRLAGVVVVVARNIDDARKAIEGVRT